MKTDMHIVTVFTRDYHKESDVVRQVNRDTSQWMWFVRGRDAAIKEAKAIAKQFPEYCVRIGRYTDQFTAEDVVHTVLEEKS